METLKLHREPLQDAWLDHYGHLNEAYYLVPFSNASWAYQDYFDIGIPYFDRTGGSLYTVESHLRYLREVRAPALIEIETITIQCDPKRLHFAHIMVVDGVERATFECMTVHFDSRHNRTAPMPEAVFAALQAARVADPPDWVGRRISMQPR